MSEGASTLYLHIGLIKTGSTFLQREVFPLISSIEYMFKPKSDLVEKAYWWSGAFSCFFDRSPAIWAELGDSLFAELFGRHAETDSGEDVLVSDENVCVNMEKPPSYLLGGRWARRGRDPFSTRAHLEELSKVVLGQYFSRIRVLVAVRRQDSWVASSYAQLSNRWAGASQDHFEEYVSSLLDPATDYYVNGVALDYHLLWQALVQAVGQQNVLMLPYELMKADMPEFLSRWFQFLEVPEEGVQIIETLTDRSQSRKRNVRSLSQDTWKIRERVRKHLRLRPGRVFAALGLPTKLRLPWPDFKRGDKIRLTPELKERFVNTYEDSNQAFAEAIGMDLSSYGYY